MKFNHTIPVQSQTIESRRGLFLFSITFCVLIFFSWAIWQKGEINLKIFFCFAFLIVLSIGFLYLSKVTRWEIHEKGFSKKGLFKNQEYLWINISSVEMDWHYHFHGAQLFLRFTFYNSYPFHFPLSFYGRKNIRIFCEAIVLACPQANISDKVHKMAIGIFPWYIF